MNPDEEIENDDLVDEVLWAVPLEEPEPTESLPLFPEPVVAEPPLRSAAPPSVPAPRDFQPWVQRYDEIP